MALVRGRRHLDETAGLEPLGKAMETILSKCGVMSPQRQRELEDVRARQLKQAAIAKAAALRGRCNVWARYQHASLDDLDLPRELLTAEEFQEYEQVRDELRTLHNAPATLVLHGGNGPGKTYLMSALVHEFCDKGLEAHFTTANDFFLGLKSTFGEKGRTQEDYVRRFRSYELLGIDEIEVRSDSDWENTQLRDLINARYSSLVSTVLVTNKTADEINGTNGTPYFSTALRDRIREDGAMLACGWRSLRGRTRD